VKAAYHHKMKVLTLVDRETKSARSVVISDLKAETIGPIVLQNVAREAALMTDEARHYKMIGPHFASHDTVQHKQDEHVRAGTPVITTNTVENHFSVFKRGMKGIYQHRAKKHLHRYLAEFDFRYSNRSANGVEDTQRARIALSMIVGKRLTYRRADGLVPALSRSLTGVTGRECEQGCRN
jgi:transposase-like protein